MFIDVYLSKHENSEYNFFLKTKVLGKISNNWTNDLLRINICMTLESCWKSYYNIILQF